MRQQYGQRSCLYLKQGRWHSTHDPCKSHTISDMISSVKEQKFFMKIYLMMILNLRSLSPQRCNLIHIFFFTEPIKFKKDLLGCKRMCLVGDLQSSICLQHPCTICSWQPEIKRSPTLLVQDQYAVLELHGLCLSKVITPHQVNKNVALRCTSDVCWAVQQ